MKRAILIIVTVTIVIGVVALATNEMFGSNTNLFLRKYSIYFTTEGNQQSMWYYYTFNFEGYIKNLQLTVTDTSVLELKTPTRAWNSDIVNDLALIIDYLIMIINIILYPLRIGAYIIQNIWALLGLNADVNDANNGFKWLVKFYQTAKVLQIPYI